MPDAVPSAAPEVALAVKAVSKSILKRRILSEVSFELPQGALYLLLGANGAGKSTLLRVLAGLAQSDKGTIEFSGSLVRPYPRIAYVGHASMLYGKLTVEQNLSLALALSGSTRKLEEYLDRWDLLSCRDMEVERLSRGQQFRTSLARGFVAHPRYVILDEPTSSLDDSVVAMMLANVNEAVANGGTAIVATHDVSRMRPAAHGALLLEKGSLAGCAASPAEIDDLVMRYRGGNR